MTDLPAARPIEILLVEDNPGDARLTIEALKECKLASRLHHVNDGVEAMAFIRKTAPFAQAPRPDLILLDLNLPRRNGREVLAELKQDPDLATIPVVVLTTSEAETDVVASYQLHANCYVAKPVDLKTFMQVVERIENFWLSIVKLPSRANP